MRSRNCYLILIFVILVAFVFTQRHLNSSQNNAWPGVIQKYLSDGQISMEDHEKSEKDPIAYMTQTGNEDTAFDSEETGIDSEENGFDSSESDYNETITEDMETKTTMLVLTNMITPKFLKDFRNPCWYEMESSGKTLVCFPYLLMPGFSKCGSTDLHARVVSHPLIITKSDRKLSAYLTKSYYRGKGAECQGQIHCGTDYFSRVAYKYPSKVISVSDQYKKMMKYFDNLPKNSKESRTWKVSANDHVMLLRKFPEESKAIVKKGQTRHKYPVITVESTSSTVWDNFQWKKIAENQGLSAPRYTTADWIHKVNPQARIIITLRDPVERAFSDYVFVSHILNTKINVQDFHARVVRSVRRINKCVHQGNPPLLCAIAQNHEVRLGIGWYAVHLKHWLEVFPRKNFFFSRFEDYVQNASRTLEQVFEFLELPPVSKEAMAFITSVGIKNQTKKKSKVGEMLEKTRELLTEFYRPHVEELAKLLGDDRYLWNFKRASDNG